MTWEVDGHSKRCTQEPINTIGDLVRPKQQFYANIYPVSMFLFRLSHSFVYLLTSVPVARTEVK